MGSEVKNGAGAVNPPQPSENAAPQPAPIAGGIEIGGGTPTASGVLDVLADIAAASDGGSGASSAPDNHNDSGAGGDAPRVVWLPEYARMRLAVAICAARGAYMQAIVDSKRNEDGRMTVDEKCRIVRIITLAWMRANGEFYANREDVSAASAYYHLRNGGRWYRLAAEEFAAWLVAAIGMEPTSREVINAQKAVALAAVDARIARLVDYSRFFARVGGRVYISCGEEEVVAISDGGIVRQRNGDGVFFPPDSVLPPWRLLPAGQDVDPLDTALYGSIASVEGERAKTLIKLWLCTLPINPANKPLLVFVGGVGSGKTKAATGVFRVLGIDNSICDFTRDSKIDDFWTVVNQGGVITVDNVDARIPWLPQSLAAASTGGSMKARKLYSSGEVVVRKANAWIVITTASPQFAQDAGCADRILKIELYRRDEPTSDSALDADIAEKRDGLLSYIARAVHGAMAVNASPPDGLNRRHPDWAAWAWRIGVALGIREAAEDALYGAEEDKSLFTIVSDEAFGLPFVRYRDSLTAEWEGDAAQLLTSLTSARIITEEDARHLSARGIGRRLSASWPFYRQVFGAEKRISSGRVIYRFSPRRGGLGGFNNAFSSFFNMSSENIDKKDQNGPVNTPNPPTPENAPPGGDIDIQPYNPEDSLI